jgi:cell wall-associated NlpC family hydrolase
MRHSALVLLGFFLFQPLLAGATTDGASTSRDRPLAQALLAVGVSYERGGHSPRTGFDCSGLVSYVFQKAWGMLLPRNAKGQSEAGAPVAMAELEPGDLVFYNTRKRPYSHVGIYLGDGRFIHAPRPGERVRVESVDSPYWRTRFDGARRLEPPSTY